MQTPTGWPALRRAMTSEGKLRTGLQSQQILMLTIEHEFAFLIMHRRAHDDDAGGLLLHKLGDFERGIERIAGENAFEEFRAHLDEADEALAHDMRKQSCARSREAQNLQAMRERRGITEALAIFVIVMDWVIVEAHR